MAANAIERPTFLRTSWLKLLASSPERLEFATRLALICSLTTLVTEIYQTPYPALAAYLPFFYNRSERTLSLILSVVFTIVIALVIALVFLVADVVVDDSMWRVIAIAVVSFCLLFLGAASRLQPIAGPAALIVGYALAQLGTIQTGELATRALLYLELAVAIPAGVSLIVNLLLAPAPRRTVQHGIADRLKLSATVLRNPASPARSELATRVREGTAALLEQVKLAGIEKSVPVPDLGALRQAALSSFALMSAVDVLAASSEVELPRALRTKLAGTVEGMAHIVQRGGYPVEVALDLPLGANSSPLARELVAAIRRAVTRFAEPDAPAPAPAPAGEEGGFWVEDAFTNPQHVQFALKTTAAAVFCYLLYSLLDWPGIHTCLITVYIVAQSTAAESVEKLTLRIIGCLIGAAAGYAAIVFLVPALTSVGALMIVVFVGAWIGAYVAGGSPRISYAGFQIAFAFFLCVIQGSGPAFDLTLARDRIIGIIIGNLIAYFALVHLWPVSISGRVDPALAAAFRQLAKVVAAKESGARRLLAAEALGSLRATETDIELARYEPSSIRSSPAWLATRQQVIENAQSVSALLLVSADTTELSRVDAAARLERLATSLSAPSDAGPVSSWVTESAHGWQTLTARVNRRLGMLEETLGIRVGTAEASARVHA
jgi:multidrug resistance protein MdtO